MKILRLLPVILAGLIFSAHVLRFYGWIPAIAAFLFLFTLSVGKSWILRLWQLYLAAATVVWIQATIGFVRYRMAMELPWTRLVIIMGLIVALTVFSIFWLETKNIKQYFGQAQKQISE